MSQPDTNKPKLLTPPAVTVLLTQILGRAVTAKKIPPFPLAAPGSRVLAAYEGDNGSLVSVCVFDLSLAAYAGAALVLAPVGVAKESITSGKCSDALLENLAEVLNICRQWFQQPGGHVNSPGVYQVPGNLPANITELLAASKSRLDLSVAIPGYGEGRLSIVA